MSSDRRIAAAIADRLRADWQSIPELAKVRVLAAERNVDITGPTAILRLKRLARFPQAPKTHRVAGVLLTLVSDREDFDRAADDLEGWTLAALDYLDTRYQPPEEAETVLYNDRLAIDIAFTAITEKE